MRTFHLIQSLRKDKDNYIIFYYGTLEELFKVPCSICIVTEVVKECYITQKRQV